MKRALKVGDRVFVYGWVQMHHRPYRARGGGKATVTWISGGHVHVKFDRAINGEVGGDETHYPIHQPFRDSYYEMQRERDDLKKLHDANLYRWEVVDRQFVTTREKVITDKLSETITQGKQLGEAYLLSAATELRMREALKKIAVPCVCTTMSVCTCQPEETARKALSAPQSPLAEVIGEIFSEIRWVVDKGDAYSGECIQETFEPLLARYDALRGGD